MSREDTFTNTEDDARRTAYDVGRDEAISGDVDNSRKPVCVLCQGGVRGFVCGPCERESA